MVFFFFFWDIQNCWNWFNCVFHWEKKIQIMHFFASPATKGIYLYSLYVHVIWQIDIQYPYIVWKYIIYLHELYKQVEEQVFLVCFTVSANFIFNNNVRILCLSCNIKRSMLSENSWNKHCFNRFQMHHLWRQCLYWYRFFLLLNRNQVPEKLYFSQWPYITKIYQVNAIWLLK